MNDTNKIIGPRERTFARWLKFAFSRVTLLRAMQYEVLPALLLQGRVLDIGGGKNVGYRSLLSVNGMFESVNISKAMEPTHICDLNRSLPMQNDTYDHVISLNTFEHLIDDKLAVMEAVRVLRPGGSFHFLVPFLYQVHASPSDYVRRTVFWWIETLPDTVVRSLVVEPLVWDRISTAYSFIGHGKLGRALKPFILFVGVVTRWIRISLGKPASHPNDSHVPIGYYISGIK